ncbi:response regulator [Salinarimonas sp.]|uniref:response regulator n=1 Tax=Salinarimonas sp. TaxID=2766526 RepID=UPI00391D07AD
MANVLVVDDEFFIREYLEEVLVEMGHAVRQAGDGLEAWEALQTGARPDLIVLDLMMPRLSGWELLDRIGADVRLAGTPILIVSGAGDVAAEGRRYGVRGVLAKPFRPADLENAIRACVE